MAFESYKMLARSPELSRTTKKYGYTSEEVEAAESKIGHYFRASIPDLEEGIVVGVRSKKNGGHCGGIEVFIGFQTGLFRLFYGDYRSWCFQEEAPIEELLTHSCKEVRTLGAETYTI